MPTNQNLIKQFIEDCIVAAGFGSLPEAFKNTYKQRLEIAFAKRLGIGATKLLADKDLKDFAALSQQDPKPSPEEIFNFYNSRIQNFDEKILEIMKNFQKNYVGGAKKLQKKEGI
jgi:hypothetical protein